MSLSVGKLYDLVFDRRAVPRTARRDDAAVHCRLLDVFLDDALAIGFEVRDPARHLDWVSASCAFSALRAPEMRPGIIELLDLALLDLQRRVVNGASIDTRRSSGLESGDGQPSLLELFSEVSSRSFPGSTAGEMCLRSDVDSTAQERA